MSRIYYTIGDIHGESTLLTQLLADIEKDWEFRRKARDEAAVVFLGDYVDRGPNSKDVIAQIIAFLKKRPSGINGFALKGNHEDMFVEHYKTWSRFGFRMDEMAYAELEHATTVRSYGGWDKIPPGVIEWLDKLPVHVRDDEHKLIFCHAGVNVHTYPQVTYKELIWSRYRDFFASHDWPDNPGLNGYTVVHGHTPMIDRATQTIKPTADARRINCDSGAVFGGLLSAAVITDGKFQKFISIQNENQTHFGG